MIIALSLLHSKTYSDKVVVFKSLRNSIVVDFGLSCSASNTRGDGVRLQQRCPKSRVLFICRFPPVWNKLSLTIAAIRPTLAAFKRLLKKHLLLSQVLVIILLHDFVLMIVCI